MAKTSINVIDDVMKAFDQQEAKSKKRASKVPKLVTLEDELTRMSNLKWSTDRYIFDAVSSSLRNKEVDFPNRKMKKDDIYAFWKVLEFRRREALKQNVRESKPDNYIIVQDLKTWAKMQRLLFKEEEAAWDTETTGLDWYEDRIVGVSAYLPTSDIAFYVPFGHTTGEQQITEQQALAPIKDWLETEGNRSIWHNYKYDAHLLANHGIKPATPYWDSNIVAKLLNEHEPTTKLKVLYDKYVAKTGNVVLFEDIIDESKIAETDVLLAGVYAAGDPHKTYLLYKFQKPFLESVGNLQNIWYNIEGPLMEIDVRMERTGLRVDVEGLHKIEQEQLPIIAQAEKDMMESFHIDDAFLAKMNQATGKDVTEWNFSSNDHLAYLIYDVLGIGDEIPKKLGKKPRSTASEVISAIIEDVPELEPLKKYRELNKIVSTYAHKIPEALEVDGRLHSQFDSLRTQTGRYASSEYGAKGHKKGTNLQNIPARSELGKRIRKCVIPDENCLFVSSDLSQIEPRVIAHIMYTWCNDSSMRDLYLAGVDLYTTMATKVFGLEYDQCVDKAKIYNEDGTYWEPRKLMKTGVLAGLYGQSVRGFSLKMGVSEEISQMFFDGLYSQFPGIQPFREKVLASLRSHGYVETLFGRKRRFPEYQKMYRELLPLQRKPWRSLSDNEKAKIKELRKAIGKMEREAINAVVQGSAADTLKMNIIQMSKLCNEHGWQYLLSIHDELMLQLPKQDVTPANIQAISDVMTKTVEFSLPLKCDTVIQPRWMEEYGTDEWDFDNCCPKEAA